MVRPRKDAEKPVSKRPPATTAEAREKRLIGLAVDLVERKLIEGTASSQETTHFLKLASVRHTHETAKLVAETKLAEARVTSMAMGENIEKLYGDAIAAMTSYQTGEEFEEYDG
jgi:hypothetical protein